ncbi:hypothetical protein [Nocardia sp. NPDC048505]|uniref:hypothetical protein n=1 Tax=unclassified Nocardia TaxID=2637762 RepID=UPI0033F3070D
MHVDDGITVAAMIPRGTLDIARTVHIVRETARVLDERRRDGRATGTLRASDIRVVEQPGGPDRVTVADPAPAETTRLPGGSADFDSETVRLGAAPAAADVRALGSVLYEMLTGAPATAQPSAPTQVNPWVPAGFDGIVAAALAGDPRFPDCATLAAAAAAAANPPAPPRRRRLALGAALVVVVSLVVGAAVLAGRDPDPDVTATPATTTSATPGTRSVQLDTALWGAYAFVAEAFPDLLPVSVDGIGYRELFACSPVDERIEEVSVDEPPRVGRVICTGDQRPVTLLIAVCNADRSRMTVVPTRRQLVGERRWTRASGTGYMRWGSFVSSNRQVVGTVEVYFDNPRRSHCYLEVDTLGSAAEVYDGWFADAPL